MDGQWRGDGFRRWMRVRVRVRVRVREGRCDSKDDEGYKGGILGLSNRRCRLIIKTQRTMQISISEDLVGWN